MKIRTLLVDSNYLLKRSFHGAKDTYTLKFGQIGGLYSFLTTIRKLIKAHAINKVVLCWDGENGGIFRHRLDREYKANRKSKDWYNKIEMSDAEIRREKNKEESILKQRKRIQAYAEELFIRQIEIDDIEADDLISSYCIKNHNKEDIFLYSKDSDFFQLLDLDIVILFPTVDTPITRKTFYTQFGYHYSNALTMKILSGDTADNIKGIKGVGMGSLMKHFPEIKFRHVSVKEICKKCDKINEERVANKKKPLSLLKNITDGLERIKLNHMLVNLKEPMLNEQAEDELEQLDMPLSPHGRGSKNLYKMMVEDEFLSVYGGTFVNYVEPFYAVIMNEKKLLVEFKNR